MKQGERENPEQWGRQEAHICSFHSKSALHLIMALKRTLQSPNYHGLPGNKEKPPPDDAEYKQFHSDCSRAQRCACSDLFTDCWDRTSCESQKCQEWQTFSRKKHLVSKPDSEIPKYKWAKSESLEESNKGHNGRK